MGSLGYPGEAMCIAGPLWRGRSCRLFCGRDPSLNLWRPIISCGESWGQMRHVSFQWRQTFSIPGAYAPGRKWDQDSQGIMKVPSGKAATWGLLSEESEGEGKTARVWLKWNITIFFQVEKSRAWVWSYKDLHFSKIHFLDRASCILGGWPWTYSIAKDDLGLLILLPLPPGCWDQGGIHYPQSVHKVLQLEPRVSSMLGKHSAEVHPRLPNSMFGCVCLERPTS